MLQAKYIDYEKKQDDYHKWLGFVLLTYFRIWLLYWREVFIRRAENKLHEIEKIIVEYQKRLRTYTDKYPFDISEAENNES